MSIRKNYIEAFDKIRKRYGWESHGHEIPENISLKGAIGYTGEFIVESGEEHFRYDYYRKKINNAPTMFGIGRVKKIVHLDLGCGPGLFSWVIRDYMLKNYGKKSGDIEFIGYDHAQNMIHLAKLFQEYLPIEYNFDGYFKVGKIRKMLNSRDFSDCDCIVTFGYVLIQIKNNREALQDFVHIIQDLFPSKSCILVAVDAYNTVEKRQDFRDMCKALRNALSDADIYIKAKPIGNTGSTMYASLSQ